MKLSKRIFLFGLSLLLILTTGCSNSNVNNPSYEAGVYTSTVQGKVGDIKVEVTFTKDKIENVEVLEHSETPVTSDNAINNIPKLIVENQSLAVDVVSGATITSEAIIKAVEECVKLADGNVDLLKEKDEVLKENETLEADIVVIGSGLSGMATTISALENGASVIIVEKQDGIGRSFVTSFGNMMIGQVEENKEYHVTESDDTLDDFIQRWEKLTTAGGSRTDKYPDYNRVSDIIIESAKTVSWLKGFGIDLQLSFSKEQRGSDIVRPVTENNKLGGLEIVEKMSKQLEDKGAVILTSTTATQLIEENSKVVGIKATSANKNYTIKAKNVVLATGGFGGSDDYINELIPEIVDLGYQFSGTSANKGDGITMAKELGAAIYDDSWIIPSPGKLMPSKKLTDINVEFAKLNGINPIKEAVINNKMMINSLGKRIADESEQGTSLISNMINKNEGPYYFLFDSSSKDVVSILESGLVTGDVIKANSIEELSKKAEMKFLVETFNNYQTMANNGKDTEFGKKVEALIPYASSGEYYLVKYVPDFVATIGGLMTDENYQVVKNNGDGIDGLYAVGELAHRFLYDRGQFGNISNNASLTMGRQVGKYLAGK